MKAQRLRIQYAESVKTAAYDIRVGNQIWSDLVAELQRLIYPDVAATVDGNSRPAQIVILTDQEQGELYLTQIQEVLTAGGWPGQELIVPNAAAAKQPAVATEVWRALAQSGFRRSDLLLVIGGSALCRLGGFIAANWQGGMNYVLLPTSLVAMMDASVGGLVSLDLPEGPDLVSNTWPPALVLADLATLDNLADAQWLAGWAVLIKALLIDGTDSWQWLQEQAEALSKRQPEPVQQAVVRAIAAKARWIVADHLDTAVNAEQAFSLGEPLAQTLRRLGAPDVTFAQALTEGLRFAARLAGEAVGASADWVDELETLFLAFGLEPLRLAADSDLNADNLYAGLLGRGAADPASAVTSAATAASTAPAATLNPAATDSAGRLPMVLMREPGQLVWSDVDWDLLKIYLIYWQQAHTIGL